MSINGHKSIHTSLMRMLFKSIYDTFIQLLTYCILYKCAPYFIIFAHTQSSISNSLMRDNCNQFFSPLSKGGYLSSQVPVFWS